MIESNSEGIGNCAIIYSLVSHYFNYYAGLVGAQKSFGNSVKGFRLTGGGFAGVWGI